MKKRIISCLLTLSMAAMLTTACGSTNDNVTGTDSWRDCWTKLTR